MADWCRVNWAVEDGGVLAKTPQFLGAQAPPPWDTIPKVGQPAAFLTIRAPGEAC